MLGKTHLTAGITTALLVMHPTTVIGVGSAVLGGAIGGTICDIDCKGSDRNRKTLQASLIAAVCIAVGIGIDLFVWNGLVNYLRSALERNSFIGCMGMVACCIHGGLSKHRTFTHSLPGLFLMSGCIWLISRPLAGGFFVGAASHILLDLLNRRGVHLLYPLKKPVVCFRLCDSDGKVNRILASVFTVSSILLGLFFLIKALIHQGVFRWLAQWVTNLLHF